MCPQEHKGYAVAFNAIAAFLFMTLKVLTARYFGENIYLHELIEQVVDDADWYTGGEFQLQSR